jgi:hypothetical protein
LDQIHTSELFAQLVVQVPDGQVDLGWLLGHLDKRAFGFLLQLLLGLVVIVPSVASIATLMTTFPSAQMLFARGWPTFSRFDHLSSLSFCSYTPGGLQTTAGVLVHRTVFHDHRKMRRSDQDRLILYRIAVDKQKIGERTLADHS